MQRLLKFFFSESNDFKYIQLVLKLKFQKSIGGVNLVDVSYLLGFGNLRLRMEKLGKILCFVFMKTRTTEQNHELLNLRLDELPLLYTVIRSIGLAKIINANLAVHKNWEGLLPGEIMEVWLCYLLSTGNHRLCSVEDWVSSRLEIFQVLSGTKQMRSYDFSDDKLGLLLDYFGVDTTWDSIELGVNRCLLGVYHLGSGSLPTFRLDAAPMQGYGQVQDGGLLQHGYHKQHANLPQFKLKLCTLDNSVNHFAYPICHLSVAGNKSDDELYIPIIAQSKKVLNGVSGFERGNLYVGDSKFGSIGNRLYVVQCHDYYLMPLSHVQLSSDDRRLLVEQQSDSDYMKVNKVFKKETKLVAEGFEKVVTLTQTVDDQVYEWKERRLFVRSTAYHHSSCAALERRIQKAQNQLVKLTERKKGKKVLHSKEQYQSAVDKILTENKVGDFLQVHIEVKESIKKIRAYGGKPAREEKQLLFDLTCQRKEQDIEQHKKYLAWQVYATNAPKELLSFEQCVWKYRHQSNIESRFDDLRNKMAPLLPVFLQKDNRIKALVNLLLLALKICSHMEYKIAKALQEKKESLEGLYEGNPKRKTDKPSAKRICKAFVDISIALIFTGKKLQMAIMTPLNSTQLKIMKLLEVSPSIYLDLTNKLQIFFSHSEVTET